MQGDDRDALAAEYVLGTLSAEERDHAEALLAQDAGFAEIVRLWEHRLGELNVMVEAVEPPPDIWDRIKTDVDGTERRNEAAAQSVELQAIELNGGQSEPGQAAEASQSLEAPDSSVEPSTRTVPDLLSEGLLSSENAVSADLGSTLLPSEPVAEFEDLLSRSTAAQSATAEETPSADQSTGRWRGLAIAASLIAAVLAVYLGATHFVPGLMARHSAATISTVQPASAPQLVAVLQQEPTPPAFLVVLDPQQRTITVRRLTAAADNGRSYELWAYSSKLPKPTSLGPVGGSEVTTRPIPENVDVETMRAATYSVSLEPADGSASGTPTGPMLFKGQMIDAAPGSSE